MERCLKQPSFLSCRRRPLPGGRGSGIILPLLALLQTDVECGFVPLRGRTWRGFFPRSLGSPNYSFISSSFLSPPGFPASCGVISPTSRGSWKADGVEGFSSVSESCGRECGGRFFSSRAKEGGSDLKLERQCIASPSASKPGSVYFEWVEKSGRDGELENSEARSLCSPWHDLPLVAFPSEGSADFRHSSFEQVGNEGEENVVSPPLLHFVVEVPLGERRKNEIMTRVPFNPIQQDRFKDGSLRFLANPMPFNYGAIPQTWEDPGERGPTEAKFALGDGDPLDAVELSGTPFPPGTVLRVKVIGALALLDCGELDWKILTISEKSDIFPVLNSVQTLEQALPGTLARVKSWFQVNKEGQMNEFGFNGKALDAAEAWGVVKQAHAFYQRLKKEPRRGPDLWLGNSSDSLS